MAGEDPSLSTVKSWPRPPTAAVVVKRRGPRREETVRRLLEAFRTLCSTQALCSIRMICISLFLFWIFEKNFHIVWNFPIGYIPNKLNHGIETKVFPIMLILWDWWQVVPHPWTMQAHKYEQPWCLVSGPPVLLSRSPGWWWWLKSRDCFHPLQFTVKLFSSWKTLFF